MADNPHYATMEEYLEILESVLRDADGGFFGRPSHPEDLGAAVETANKHIESVMSYWARKWYDDQKKKDVTASAELYDKINVSDPRHYNDEQSFRDPY